MDNNELAYNEVNGNEPPPSSKTINSSLNGSSAVIINVVPSISDSAAPTSHNSATMMMNAHAGVAKSTMMISF